MSSPVWQTKPSIKRPSSIAFATSPSTVVIKRADGFVCPPTEPTSALMTERVSLMSIYPTRDRAAPCPRRWPRRGDGPAHWQKTPDVSIGSTVAVLARRAGLIRLPGKHFPLRKAPCLRRREQHWSRPELCLELLTCLEMSTGQLHMRQ